MVEEISLRIDTFSRDVINRFEKILRENYALVVNTGITRNQRPPNEGMLRGYFTIAEAIPHE